MTLAAVIYAVVGVWTFLGRAYICADVEDFRMCFGQALLWPLFVAKFVALAVFEAAKDLAA